MAPGSETLSAAEQSRIWAAGMTIAVAVQEIACRVGDSRRPGTVDRDPEAKGLGDPAPRDEHH
jgi:hypothetical protein